MTNTSESGRQASEGCQRCEDGEATSKFKLGANRQNAQYSTFRICDGCTRSLGEWFDAGSDGGDES